jgi:UDP-galactopyranose mutase
VERAKVEKHISFLGRLGTYRYLDMDVTIGEALATADEYLRLAKNRAPIPTFFVAPI